LLSGEKEESEKSGERRVLEKAKGDPKHFGLRIIRERYYIRNFWGHFTLPRPRRRARKNQKKKKHQKTPNPKQKKTREKAEITQKKKKRTKSQ